MGIKHLTACVTYTSIPGSVCADSAAGFSLFFIVCFVQKMHYIVADFYNIDRMVDVCTYLDCKKLSGSSLLSMLLWGDRTFHFVTFLLLFFNFILHI